MRTGSCLRRRLWVLGLGCLPLAAPAFAAPVLRSADVRIAASAPSSCDVSMTLQVDGGAPIDHRLEVPAGTEIDNLIVQGARQIGEPHAIGRTRSLVLSPEQSAYTVSYRVRQDASREYRCPLWVPAAPADGVSRAVHLRVTLPFGAEPRNTMPRFNWTNNEGVVTLGHLPAFVLIPYGAAGTSPGWNITAAMDAAAVAVFVCASAIWLWRKRGG
jgi:hypothetical protein